MENMKHKTAIIGVLLMIGLGAKAHDFSATVGGQRLYFDITNKAKRTAAVTFNESISEKKKNNVSGKVEIPSKVKHENVIYEITAINPKAFADAKSLKGITIPAGIETIGDFAFEGCDSLTSIVFPGNVVSIGQGVFFKCPVISDVSIGSDWKSIDFTMFRWSKNLTKINIPAKIEKIQGLKSLKSLTAIAVDPNNENFAAYDGILYSKDGKTLYACPRAYAGEIKIHEGTEKVTIGALIDCVEVTSIDFPTSLQTLSFRETSRMKKLETVLMRPTTPIMAAYIDSKGKLLLQIANENVSIVIPSVSKKKYETAIATEAGEYSVSTSGVPYMVTEQQIPTKKNFKGTKNFDKY